MMKNKCPKCSLENNFSSDSSKKFLLCRSCFYKEQNAKQYKNLKNNDTPQLQPHKKNNENKYVTLLQNYTNRSLEIKSRFLWIGKETQDKISLSRFIDDHKDFIMFFNGFKKKLTLSLEKLDDEQKNKFTRLFNKNNRKATTIKQNSGIWPLRIGFPFVIGKSATGNTFRTPLLTKEIKIKITLNKITLESIVDKIDVNNILVYKILKDKDIDSSIQIIEHVESIEEGIKYFSNFVDFEAITEPTINSFPSLSKENVNKMMSAIQNKGFIIEWSPVALNISNLFNYIYNDNKKILERATENLDNNTFLEVEKDWIDPQQAQNQERIINDKDFWNDIFRISSLNVSQEKIIAQALENNICVQGPPGTGKTHTIANLIINLIAKQKTAIVTSEKWGALEVLKNKLNKFLSSVAIITSEKDIRESTRFICQKIIDVSKLNDENGQEINFNIDKTANNLFKNDKLKEILKKRKRNFDMQLKIKETFKIEMYEFLNIYNKNKHYFKDLLANIRIFLSQEKKRQNKDVRLFYNISFVRGVFTKEVHNVMKNILFLKNSLLETIFSRSHKLLNVLEDERLFSLLRYKNRQKIIEKYFFHYKVYKQYKNVIIDQNKQDIEIASYIKKYSNLVVPLHKEQLNEIRNSHKINIRNNYNNDLQFQKDYREIVKFAKHQLSLKRKTLPIKQLIDKHWHALKKMIPIWIIPLELACKYFKLKPKLFDYGILDEASQIFVNRALPIIYRTKLFSIFGDSKQMQPGDNFKVNFVDQNTEDGEFNFSKKEETLYKYKSILDWAQTHCFNDKLSYHYRSKNSKLIEFSNSNFYDEKLEVCQKAKENFKPIKVINTTGTWKDNCNLDEANMLCIELDKFMTKYSDKSFAIITFNFHQKELIDELIHEKYKLQLKFPKIFENAKEPLIIRNIENIQGDERDIVFFSVGYGKYEKDLTKIPSYFGSLSQPGGENRLNVALTRAKEKIVVVKSVYYQDVIGKTTTSVGTQTLYNWINYLDNKICQSKEEDVKEFNRIELNYFESIFEERFLEVINLKTYPHLELRSQVKIGKYSSRNFVLDFAIWDKINKKYLLAIELDGKQFHANSYGELKKQDLDRQLFLEQQGWRFKRFWYYDFKKNWCACIRQIEIIINGCGEYR